MATRSGIAHWLSSRLLLLQQSQETEQNAELEERLMPTLLKKVAATSLWPEEATELNEIIHGSALRMASQLKLKGIVVNHT